MHRSLKYAGILLIALLPLILLLACSLPILIKYSDGLEATNAKRNNLMVASLVPLGMTIIGFYLATFTIKKCISLEKTEETNNNWCRIIFVIIVIVLGISIPVGIVFGKRFASIPDSCATQHECQSYCTDRNVTFTGNLTNIQYVDAIDGNFSCGTCYCICHVEEDCNPVQYSDSGFSTPTKIAIGVLLICIGMVMCCSSKVCRNCMQSTLKYIGILFLLLLPFILILGCSLPILMTFSDGLEATNAKRNNLMVATILPLFLFPWAIWITIQEVCAIKSDDDDRCGKRCHRCNIFLIFSTVIAMSVGLGVYCGIRFSSIPSACATMDECQSLCTTRNESLRGNLTYMQHETFQGNLTNIQHFDAIDGNFTCGTCYCICHVEEDCNPVQYSDSGFGTTTKVAIGILSGLTGLLMCIVCIVLRITHPHEENDLALSLAIRFQMIIFTLFGLILMILVFLWTLSHQEPKETQI